MEESLEHLSGEVFATYWMPLDGLIEQWGRFGTQAVGTSALHVASVAYSALAREMQALEHYTAAWHAMRGVDVTELENALEELNQARERWTDAMASLQVVVLDRSCKETVQDEMRILIAQAMEQRLRVSSLILEVEREQFAAYKPMRT